LPDTLTANDAAERLGVSVTTVKNWLNQLPEEKEHDSRGRVRIDANTLAVLETVKTLRGEDCGYETIRRRIGQSTGDQKSPDSEPPAGSCQPTFDRQAVDTTAIVEAVTEAVMAAVRGDNEIARMYGAMGEQVAKAAHTIGQLEERTRGLEAERDRLAAELAAQVARHAEELVEARAERDQARAVLAASSALARPWWKNLWA
jgi:transposase-like protein